MIGRVYLMMGRVYLMIGMVYLMYIDPLIKGHFKSDCSLVVPILLLCMTNWFAKIIEKCYIRLL